MSAPWEARGPEAPLHMLAHDFAMRQLPPLAGVLGRLGAIRANPRNAIAALERGAQVLVYPGGDLDAYRHGRRRDEVVLGKRTGFVRVAQAAGMPILEAWPSPEGGAACCPGCGSDAVLGARRCRTASPPARACGRHAVGQGPPAPRARRGSAPRSACVAPQGG